MILYKFPCHALCSKLFTSYSQPTPVRASYLQYEESGPHIKAFLRQRAAE